MKTVLKFWIAAYNNKIKEEYEDKVLMAVFAENEEKAKEKAKTVCTRQSYEVYEIAELFDDSKK